MPTLTIKGLPDPVYHQLKQRAEQNRRSLNSEILVCLEQALVAEPLDAQAALARVDAVRRKLRIPRLSDAKLRAMKSEGRP